MALGRDLDRVGVIRIPRAVVSASIHSNGLIPSPIPRFETKRCLPPATDHYNHQRLAVGGQVPLPGWRGLPARHTADPRLRGFRQAVRSCASLRVFDDFDVGADRLGHRIPHIRVVLRGAAPDWCWCSLLQELRKFLR